MYLSLPLPSGKGISKVSIGQCIENFVRPETLEGDDAWWVGGGAWMAGPRV
jgi:ubiquitin carboxyl-terminal hydrolase 8